MTSGPACFVLAHADICAFGPRDYVNEVRVGAAELHNKPPPPSSGSQQQPKKAHSYKEGDFDIDDTLR